MVGARRLGRHRVGVAQREPRRVRLHQRDLPPLHVQDLAHVAPRPPRRERRLYGREDVGPAEVLLEARPVVGQAPVDGLAQVVVHRPDLDGLVRRDRLGRLAEEEVVVVGGLLRRLDVADLGPRRDGVAPRDDGPPRLALQLLLGLRGRLARRQHGRHRIGRAVRHVAQRRGRRPRREHREDAERGVGVERRVVALLGRQRVGLPVARARPSWLWQETLQRRRHEVREAPVARQVHGVREVPQIDDGRDLLLQRVVCR